MDEACTELGLSPSRLEQLRDRALAAALQALEPRSAGRPRHREEPSLERLAQLEARVAELERELTLSRAREELAAIRSPAPTPKKTRRRRR
jgi:hypothetical protein